MTALEWLLILLALGIGALLGYLLRGGGAMQDAVAGLLAAKEAVIKVSSDGSGKCVSVTTPYTLLVKRLQFVHWIVEDSASCMPAGSTVQLRFTSGSPLHKNQPDHPKSIVDIVLSNAALKKHPYKVWLVLADGSSSVMEDPELEVNQ